MTVAALVAAGLVLLIAALVVRSGIRGLAVVRALLATPTSTVSSLVPGVVELTGVLRARGPEVTGLSGEAGVVVHLHISWRKPSGKSTTEVGTHRMVRACAAVLDDATGTCRLDLAEATLVGAFREGDGILVADLVAFDPALEEIVPATATTALVRETILVDGARVLVRGEARAETMTVAAAYRGASREAFVVGSSETDHLLVASGGQARLVLRALVPALVTIVFGAMIAVVPALVVWVLVW